MSNKKKPQVINEHWLYMNDKEITVVDINEVLKDKIEIDLWDELGVISLKLEDGNHIDIEEIETDLGDENQNKFVQDHNVKSICTVIMNRDSLELAKKVMQIIITGMGGFFCKDNDDFTPLYK